MHVRRARRAVRGPRGGASAEGGGARRPRRRRHVGRRPARRGLLGAPAPRCGAVRVRARTGRPPGRERPAPAGGDRRLRDRPEGAERPAPRGGGRTGGPRLPPADLWELGSAARRDAVAPQRLGLPPGKPRGAPRDRGGRAGGLGAAVARLRAGPLPDRGGLLRGVLPRRRARRPDDPPMARDHHPCGRDGLGSPGLLLPVGDAHGPARCGRLELAPPRDQRRRARAALRPSRPSRRDSGSRARCSRATASPRPLLG